jgi:hypothetical protein
MAYPNADIYEISKGRLRLTKLEDTEHFQITKYFMMNPDKMLAELGINVPKDYDKIGGYDKTERDEEESSKIDSGSSSPSKIPSPVLKLDPSTDPSTLSPEFLAGFSDFCEKFNKGMEKYFYS